MLWRGRRESGNIEDRRSFGPKGFAIGGGVLGLIYLLVNFFLGGGDLSQLQQMQGEPQEMSATEEAADEERRQFVGVVLAETEDVWHRLMSEMGREYEEPKLVLFRQSVESECGMGSAAMGPFYCPADYRLYIDLSFYEDLQQRFHAPGDFPMAYVIAHEVGHHVQNLMGISDKIQNLRGRLSEKEMNKYLVKMELQADFLAGVWAHHTQRMKNIIEEGDIEEALNAANAIGDDRLQKQSRGYVVPDAFTHGTSEQRMYWFRKGFETGDIRQGDTFNAPDL